MKNLNVFCLFVLVTVVGMGIDLWVMIFVFVFHLAVTFALEMEIVFVEKSTFFFAMVTFGFEHLLFVVID